MIKSFKKGTSEVINDLTVHIPPVGYVYDPATRELEYTGVYQRSKKKEDQYWERDELPADFTVRWKKQEKRREVEADYYDPEVAKYVNGEWAKRLKGFWFMNNGEPTYITGLHWYYLKWWYLGDTPNGYPGYWNDDREFFYFLQYCLEDANCAGLIYVTSRRKGKTAKSAVFGTEYVTRAKHAHFGIQSKTDVDAEKVVYKKGVKKGFDKLPAFFKPVYDYTSTLKSGIEFRKPAKRGTPDPSLENKPELDSQISYMSSEPYAYDGEKLMRYVGDEIFKVKNFDPGDRHDIIYPTLLDIDENIVGKALYTSTVEDIEGRIDQYRTFWNESDQNNKNENGRTGTGLYRYFLPSYRTRERDKYGFADDEKNKAYYLEERRSRSKSPERLNSFIKKFPFTVEEAFRSAKTNATIRNSDAINKVLGDIGFCSEEELYETGDFEWNDSTIRDYVVWKKRSNGKFRVSWLFENEGQENNVGVKNGKKNPLNKMKFCMGADPYDHKYVDGSKRSDGAFYLYRKFDALDESQSDKFIVEYIGRPLNPKDFYEDALKACHYYGCTLLFENQKPGIGLYFEEEGFVNFLLLKEGLPSSTKVHHQIVDYIEAYIEENIEKVRFPRLLSDWLEFEIEKTQKYDPTMASGFTLIAASLGKTRQKEIKELPMASFFKPNKLKL